MAKYMMVYKSAEPFDLSTLPKEQMLKIANVWGEWLGSLGSSLVERGDTFKSGGKTITNNGVHEADNLLSGYSIIEASSVDEALEIAKGSPILQNGGSVEVYEAFGA
jgi:hypothetical protein